MDADLVCHSNWRVASVAVTGLVLLVLISAAGILLLPDLFLRRRA